MRIQKSYCPCSPPLTGAALDMLLAYGISILSADASTSWVEVHPAAIKEMAGIELIHFIDADTGWAEARNLLLDTTGIGRHDPTSFTIIEDTDVNAPTLSLLP